MYKLKYLQKLPLSIEECWDFFSSPANLKKLSPEKMGFDITTDPNPSKMYAGQILGYIIRPVFKFPLKWVTEITHVEEPNYFIDEQRFGPYKFWHHEHRFKKIEKGIEMVDTVYYKMPFGPIGSLLHKVKVRNDLEEIFRYRREKLEKLFGPYKE